MTTKSRQEVVAVVEPGITATAAASRGPKLSNAAKLHADLPRQQSCPGARLAIGRVPIGPTPQKLRLHSFWAASASPFFSDFSGTNGIGPYSGVTLDSRRATSLAQLPMVGPNGVDTVFKIAVGTTNLATIVSFNGTNGSNPPQA